jgi:hypothetical protein
MSETRHTKFLREGEYIAVVEFTLSEAPEAWEPYVSFEDALNLDVVRQALKTGDVETARRLGKVYRLVESG